MPPHGNRTNMGLTEPGREGNKTRASREIDKERVKVQEVRR